MNVDLQGVLNNLDRAYVMFEHDNGERMSKGEVKALLEYGLRKGYKTLEEISPEEEKSVLDKLKST